MRYLAICSIPALWLAFSFALPAVQERSRSEEGVKPPEGYQQIVPRGGIAAIDNPHFVTAGEARISGDTWVLGVVIQGQARAYSLNLLNHHEVVNDRAGDTAFAAVW